MADAPFLPQQHVAHKDVRYRNFDVEVRRDQGTDYAITVRNSPAGEARETIRFPFDEQTLERRQDKLQIALGRGRTRQICTEDELPVRDFGRELFDTLFSGEIRSRYDTSRQIAMQQDRRGLRIRLRLDAPELVALPWEFLYDPRQGDYVSLSRDTPVVRYMELPLVIKPFSMKPPLRILCMVASPNDRTPLDVAREKTLVDDAVRPLRQRGLVEVEWSDGQTWRDLQQKMREGPWHIFHFIGHGGFDKGADEGFIALRADDGSTYPLHAQQLARLLADHASLRLVVLNSCEGARGSQRDIFSSTSSILIRRGIPAVVAMQFPISDDAAIEFSRSFYESLVTGYPVDASMAEARKAVSTAFIRTVEWGTPVLYLRAPDGVLFDIERQDGPIPGAEVTGLVCRVCGAQNPDTNQFCRNCGNILGKPEPAAPALTPPPAYVPSPSPVASGSETSSVQLPAEESKKKSEYPKGFSILGYVCLAGGLGLTVLILPFVWDFNWFSFSYVYLLSNNNVSFFISGILFTGTGLFLIFRKIQFTYYLLLLNLLLVAIRFTDVLWAWYFGNTLEWIIMSAAPGFSVYFVFRYLRKKYPAVS